MASRLTKIANIKHGVAQETAVGLLLVLRKRFKLVRINCHNLTFFMMSFMKITVERNVFA